MEKEIKFRLRIKGQKEFEYVSLDDFIEDYGLSERLCIVEVLSKDEFTGLKDKNNKEIYGGDIVNEKNERGESAIVKFIDGSFVFWAGNEQSPCQEWYIKNNDIEVIGNIYENPELLK